VREIVKLIVVLTAFCVCSAFSLAFVKEATKEKIEYQKLKILVAPAVKAVFPSYDNDPILERVKVKLSEKEVINVFPAKKAGAKKAGSLIGIAYEGIGSGHGGAVEVLVGIDLNGKILGIKVVKHGETPGIGTKAVESQEFLNQFKGKGVGSKLTVGGDIVAVSGATETSAAITEAVRKAIEIFPKLKEEVRG